MDKSLLKIVKKIKYGDKYTIEKQFMKNLKTWNSLFPDPKCSKTDTISLELVLEIVHIAKLINTRQYRLARSKRNEINDSIWIQNVFKIFQITGDIEDFVESLIIYSNKPSVKRRNTWSASLVLSETQEEQETGMSKTKNEKSKNEEKKLFTFYNNKEGGEPSEKMNVSKVHRYSKTSNVINENRPN